MLRNCVLLGILPAAVVLAGCQTTKVSSAYQFEEYRVYVSESKKNRDAEIAECAKGVGEKKDPSDKAFSVVMGVRQGDADRAFCQRYIDGIISGRITYNDHVAFIRN